MNGSLGTSAHNIHIGTYTPRRKCDEATGQDNESDDGDEDEPSWRLVNDMNERKSHTHTHTHTPGFSGYIPGLVDAPETISIPAVVFY